MPRRSFVDAFETLFASWTQKVIRHRFVAIGASLGLVAAAFTALPALHMDNSVEAFLHDEDPVVVALESFRDRYGRDDWIIVAVRTPDLFSAESLQRLRALHDELERDVPHIAEVRSLVNARDTRGDGDTLVVGELMEDWPETDAARDAIRARALRNPLFEQTLISRDGQLTTLLLRPLTWSTVGGGEGDDDALAGFDDDDAAPNDAGDAAPIPLSAPENDALMAALRDVLERHHRDDFTIHHAGALPLTDTINRGVIADLAVFFPLAFFMIVVFLGLLFRRVTGVVLPVLVVLLSLVTSLGVMVWLGLPGSVASQILPIFLLTVGVCDSVHILTLVYQRLEAGDTRDDAIVWAMAHSGLAVLMTSLTTAAGMASFITAELGVIADLGIIAPIGVMLAFVYTVVLLPALLACVPMHARGPSGSASGAQATGPLVRAIVRGGDFAIRRPWIVIGASAGVVAVAVLGIMQLEVTHSPLNWFPEDEPMRLDFEVIDGELGGAISMEIVIDSGREDGLKDPELLRRIEAAARWAEANPVGPVTVGKATSIVDVVKEIHRALNEDRPEMAVVPDDRALVAQELLLFEQSGSDDLEELIDPLYREARLTLRVPWVDALLYGPFLEAMRAGVQERLGSDVTIESTGVIAVLAEAISAVIVSMGRSYAFALAAITPMLMLLLGSLRLGLVAMIPNLIPVIFTLGLMGWLDIKLDSTTMMIGAMVIGISVDDTIHFMHKFRSYLHTTGDVGRAVRETLSTTGAAMLVTTLVLAAGFFTMCFGSFSNTRALGGLSAVACIVAFACDVLLAPALVRVVGGGHPRPKRRASRTRQ